MNCQLRQYLQWEYRLLQLQDARFRFGVCHRSSIIDYSDACPAIDPLDSNILKIQTVTPKPSCLAARRLSYLYTLCRKRHERRDPAYISTRSYSFFKMTCTRERVSNWSTIRTFLRGAVQHFESLVGCVK